MLFQHYKHDTKYTKNDTRTIPKGARDCHMLTIILARDCHMIDTIMACERRYSKDGFQEDVPKTFVVMYQTLKELINTIMYCNFGIVANDLWKNSICCVSLPCFTALHNSSQDI